MNRSRRRSLRRFAPIAGLLLAGGLLVGPGSPTRVVVPAGESLQHAVDLAPSGSVVRLEPGIHRGPIRILKPLTLDGSRRARIVSPSGADASIYVGSDRVRIAGITAAGGSTGIFIKDAEGIAINDVAIQGAVLHGIELSGASAHITSVHIERMRHPMAQGIEIRNSYYRPKTIVAGTVVSGGWEGLVSHASRVHYQDNSIVGTTMRGIKVTEMSKGKALRNRISEASGMGLYCGDESRCAFSNNVVEVSAGSGAKATAGWGLVVEYRSTASTNGDLLNGTAGAHRATTHSRIVDRSPLRPGAGRDALLPWSFAAGAAIALLVVVHAGVRFSPVLRRLTRSKRPADYAKAATVVLLVGLGVQTFHMAEHFLQAYRVHFDGVPSHGGIVGPVVEAEVIHFTYNAAVFAAVLFLLLARRRGWHPTGARRSTGDELLLVALLVQSYHVVEHSVKVFQHIITGAKVNPGILGGMFDLVWLHFAINLTVYLAFLGASVAYLYRSRVRASRAEVVLTEPAPTS